MSRRLAFSLLMRGLLVAIMMTPATAGAQGLEMRAEQVTQRMIAAACEALVEAQDDQEEATIWQRFPVPREPAARRQLARLCASRERHQATLQERTWSVPSLPEGTVIPDGTLLSSQRLLTLPQAEVDVVTYASSGLVVTGLLCYRPDGQRHSTVLHLHGGYGGIFVNADGNMLQTCIDWAQFHNRTAFAPSYRGQDGGEGQLEVCLGEADDVAAAVAMVRALPVVDAERVGVVGGSVGGCIALRASQKIPNLRAVVAFVPPTDWKAVVEYHRFNFTAATETLCDGSTFDWTEGGHEIADFIDITICGQIGCPDEVYTARSPLPGVHVQSAPTMIVAAGLDNIVPTDQQLLWPLLRADGGNPVQVVTTTTCAEPFTMPLAFDVLVFVEDGFHGLAPGPVADGLLFLMDSLDQGITPGVPLPRD